MNAQSICGKVGELCVVSNDLSPDIILITESWCNAEITNAFLDVPGYELKTDLRRDRSDTRLGVGGGLLVYGKPGVKILPDNDCSHEFNQYCRFDLTNRTDYMEEQYSGQEGQKFFGHMCRK